MVQNVDLGESYDELFGCLDGTLSLPTSSTNSLLVLNTYITW